MAPSPEWAVRLDGNVVREARLEELLAVREGVELHLVDDRRLLGALHRSVDLVSVEVRDADRTCVAELACTFHSGPGPERAAGRPVDDVEVDVVEAEPAQAGLELGDGSSRRGKNFVVTKISSRGTPLSRRPTPTLSSLP